MQIRIIGWFLPLVLCLTGFLMASAAAADKFVHHDPHLRYATVTLVGAKAKESRYPSHRARSGVLRYTPRGPEFRFRLEAHGLLPLNSYTLVYLPEPFPNQGLICFGSASSNVVGVLHMRGAPDLNSDLPLYADGKHKHRSRIALVLSYEVDCANRLMLSWDPAQYLFARQRVRYHDTNITTVDYNGTYCATSTQPDSTRLLELLITQSGSTLTASADGITLSGTLSGRSATLSGILPDGTTVTITFQFSNDGESFAGTVTYGSEVVTITGTRGRCFDYEFPSGEPQCVLPVANTDLVVGGQQFNSEYAGVVHTGLDFTFASPLPAIVAPCDGVVVEINQHPIALDNIITDVVIKYNDDWSTFIAFEPYSPDPTIAEAQASQIAVTVGQVVHRGDLLGHLFVPDPITAFPHIHWQVQRDGEAQIPECPRNFLMPDEQEALDVLYGSFGLLPVCLPSP